MRRLILLVGVICCVQGLFQSSIPQGSLFSREHISLLERSPMGRDIIRLAELQSKSSQVDFSGLFNAIDDLQNDLEEKKSEENTSFEQDTQRYYADQQHYSNQVTMFSNEVAQLTVDVEDLTESRSSYQTQLERKVQEQVQTTSQRLKIYIV